MYTDFFADGRPRITGLHKLSMCGKYNCDPFQKWAIEGKLVVFTNSHMRRSHLCRQMWRKLPYSSYYLLTETSCKTAKEDNQMLLFAAYIMS